MSQRDDLTSSVSAERNAAERASAWGAALPHDRLPAFVMERLQDAGAGRTPWLSTMTPAELRLARTHGLKPIAAVSGTCWYQYGRSWTEGHAAGWRAALARLRNEALACGANAVVDVRLRTVHSDLQASMDFTLIGTAVRVEGLAPSPDPVIATVPALEFVRLLEMDIVPCGLAIGAKFEWMTSYSNANIAGAYSWTNQILPELSSFWERVRRAAHSELRADAMRQGNGVLANTHFGQLIRQEVDKQPPRYLGRHIVMGTVVQTRPGAAVPHHIQMVVDMRDDLSPLLRGKDRSSIYNLNETEGGI
jgi:uncharacterized protein YbjQ (UPF0145 family)